LTQKNSRNIIESDFYFDRKGGAGALREPVRTERKLRIGKAVYSVPESAAGLLMLLPALLFLAAVFVIPLIQVIGLSFTDPQYAGRGLSFVGAANYRYLFAAGSGTVFWQALLRTAVYAAVRVTADLLLSLAAVSLLDRAFKGRRFHLTAFLAPLLIPAAVTGLIWQMFYDPNIGLFNRILLFLGLPGSRWLYGESTALLSVLLFSIWRNVGVNILILTAGLRLIPASSVEAARLDGCGERALFRHIKLPLLKPYLYFAAVIDLIESLRTFTDTNILTPSSGPLNSTMLAVNYIHKLAFRDGHFGRAAACAVILMMICLGLARTRAAVARSFRSVSIGRRT